MSSPAVIVHGGSGVMNTILIDNIDRKVIEEGIKASARKGWEVLAASGSALDAVQAAVISMEDNVVFNAGIGSFYTSRGDVEMEAALMDGATLRVGAVACIKNIANPIKLARTVMEESHHCIMMGEGAKEFAVSKHMELVPDEFHNSEKAATRLKLVPTYSPSVQEDFDPETRLSSGICTVKPSQLANSKSDIATGDGQDTVGAVAVDLEGNVAFACSTGGISAKLPGRCGGSCVIGAGGFADNQSGAVTSTGHGESSIKTCLSRHVCYLLEQGQSPQQACDSSLDYMKRQVGGLGGLIALDTKGRVGVSFTTGGMSWASIQGQKNNVIQWGICPGEYFSEDI